jgi:hypothetical protein
MKTIKNLLSIFVILTALTFISCENEPLDATLLNNVNSNNSGGGNAQPSNDYWPTAINNTWTLQQNGTNLAPMKIVSTETINGNLYYKFATQSSNGATNNNYLRKSGGSYFLRTSDTSLNLSGLTGTQTGFEFTVLKDNIPVNGTWDGTYNQTTTYTGIPSITQTTDYTGTILAKDVTETVNGVTYNNVIKLKIQQETTSTGLLSIVNTEYWFAKNVGIIRSKTYAGSGIYTSILVNYTLF